MLANSFSFLPVKRGTDWCLLSDLDIANYLGTEVPERRKRLAQNLDAAGIPMKPAKFCAVDTPLEEALRMFEGSQDPLLVCLRNRELLPIGIVAPFDFL
jgi:hypothetical protein